MASRVSAPRVLAASPPAASRRARHVPSAHRPWVSRRGSSRRLWNSDARDALGSSPSRAGYRRVSSASASASADPPGRPPPPALVLIGGRGCGKSALCRSIAAADPRFTLHSLDDMIVRDAGAAIPAIVDERGWHHFRDLEFEACETAARLAADATHHEDWTLIDAGGGVIVDLDAAGNEIFSKRKIDALRGGRAREADAARRRRRNVIVYIKRDVSYLLNRTSGDANRPSLSETHSFATVMRRREPWYFDAADYVVDATGGAVESAVKKKREIKEEVLEYFYAETGEEAWNDES